MSTEIERKFLVRREMVPFPEKGNEIIQGYLSRGTAATVRIRISDDRGFITIKGKSANGGMSRYEWEKEIPGAEAEELIKLCEPGIIEKTRYLIPLGHHVFEVDVFSGDNEGLIVAEVELTSEGEEFERPAWLSDEVTGDKRYYNSHLAKKPFNSW